MVCLGNICRSPLAEGILRTKIEERALGWAVDSAGTAGYHTGASPDERSIAVALKNNVDISDQSARKFRAIDFEHFDYILTMDAQNYQDVKRLAGPGQDGQVELIMNYLHPGENRTVPDPYYGGVRGFDEVYALLDAACDAFIEKMTS